MATLGMITLVVDDYDDAIAYYRDAVGFELVEDTPMSPEKRWVVMSPGGDGARIILAKAASDAQRAAIGNQTGGRVAFFLYTDDFDRDHSRMSAAGVHFLEQPRTEDFGKVAVFADKYGNKWDFIERRSS
jgi:catechol 2,3-dioxygenase-like lactoylglutathione lyase family enzyme